MSRTLRRRTFLSVPVVAGAVGAGFLLDRSDSPPVGDGETDDGPTIQAAGDAALDAGLGTLVLPEGRFRISTPIRWDGRGGRDKHKALNVVGTGIGTQLVIDTGERDAAVEFKGFEEVRVAGVTFVGVPGVNTDARQTVQFHNVHHASLVDCSFYGLSSLVADGSIVHAEESDLLVERCTFRGCTANSGLDCPIINNANWFGLVVRSTWFIDYGDLDGIFHSKTPIASAAGFIRLGQPAKASVNAMFGAGEAVIDDVRVDEGCYRAVYVHASEPIDSIRIRGLRHNGNSAEGATGLHVQHTKRLLVESSWFGYRPNAGGRAIALLAVDDAEINDTYCVDEMGEITADEACERLRINRTVYTSLRSDASDTEVAD